MISIATVKSTASTATAAEYLRAEMRRRQQRPKQTTEAPQSTNVWVDSSCSPEPPPSVPASRIGVRMSPRRMR
eukprot:847764-Prymnesium_polylepis.1